MSRVVAIKLEFDGGQAVKELNSVEEAVNAVEKELRNLSKKDALQGAEDNLKNLDRIIGENALSVQEMTKAMENYKNIAAVAGRQSPIGKEALKRAGALKDEIDGLSKDVDQLAKDGQNLQAALQLGSGVVAGYQAFQGVTALVGEENEELLEVMVKLQAAQGLLMSIEQVRMTLEKESVLVTKSRAFWENATARATALRTKLTIQSTAATKVGTIATRVWNSVLNSSPIFLIITALMAFSAGVYALSKAIGTETAEQRRNNAVKAKRNELDKEAASAIGEEKSKLDSLIGTVKRGTASYQEKNKAIEEIQKQYPEYLGNITEEGILTGELSEAIDNQIALIEARAKVEAAANAKKEAYGKLVEAEIEAAKESEVGLWDRITAVQLGIKADEAQILAKQGAINVAREELDVIKEVESAYLETADSLEANIPRFGNFIKNLVPSDKDIKAMEDAVKKARDKAKAQAKKAAEERKKEEEDRIKNEIEAQQFLDDLMIEVMEEGQAKREAQRLAQLDKQIQQLESKGQLTAEIEKQLTAQAESDLEKMREEFAQERLEKELQRQANRQNAVIEAMKEGAEKELEAQRVAFDTENQLLEEQGVIDDELKAAREERQQEKLQEIRDKWAEIEKEKDKKKQEALVANQLESVEKLSNGIEKLAKFNDAITETQLNKAEGNEAKQNEIRKKAFKREKALNIARALIAGAQSALQGIAKFGPPPSPAGIASIASAAAITAAQVAAIASAKFDGSGGGGLPSISAPSGSGVGGGNQNEDTTTETAPLVAPQDEGEPIPTKVFVSAVDISNVQRTSAKIDTIGTLD